MFCDCVAARSSSVDQRRALSSSAFGPRVGDGLCLLEGLVDAGMKVEAGELGIAKREQALMPGQFSRLSSV